MKHVSDALVGQIVIEWDGRPGAFLTRTEPVNAGDNVVGRVLRAFPIVSTWDDAFLMAECAVRRINCGMDMRMFTYERNAPVVVIRDEGDDDVSMSEPAFNALLVRLFQVMIAGAQESRAKIMRAKDWSAFVRDVAALAEK